MFSARTADLERVVAPWAPRTNAKPVDTIFAFHRASRRHRFLRSKSGRRVDATAIAEVAPGSGHAHTISSGTRECHRGTASAGRGHLFSGRLLRRGARAGPGNGSA